MRKEVKINPSTLKLRNIRTYLYKDVLLEKEPLQLNFINTFFPDIVLKTVTCTQDAYDCINNYICVKKNKRGYTLSYNDPNINALYGSLMGRDTPSDYDQINLLEKLQIRIAEDLRDNVDKIHIIRKCVINLFDDFSEVEKLRFYRVFGKFIDRLETNGKDANLHDHNNFKFSEVSYETLIRYINEQWVNNTAEGKINAFSWMLIGALLGSRVDSLLIKYDSFFAYVNNEVAPKNTTIKNNKNFTCDCILTAGNTKLSYQETINNEYDISKILSQDIKTLSFITYGSMPFFSEGKFRYLFQRLLEKGIC